MRALSWTLPVASAQVKSAILLAGLYADGVTSVTEPAVTRDHTERMFTAMGIEVGREDGRIAVEGGQELVGARVEVPGDLSSAAFVMLAACISDSANVLIRNVGVNPTRTGVIAILQAMGGDGCIRVHARLEGTAAEITLRDDGPGLASTRILHASE
mgnify:CR=1 FL=1